MAGGGGFLARKTVVTAVVMVAVTVDTVDGVRSIWGNGWDGTGVNVKGGQWVRAFNDTDRIKFRSAK